MESPLVSETRAVVQSLRDEGRLSEAQNGLLDEALTVWSHQASSGLPFSVKHRGRGAAGLLHSGEADMEEEDREWNGPGEQRWLGSATWGQMALPTDVAAGIMSALVPEALSGARLVCRAWAEKHREGSCIERGHAAPQYQPDMQLNNDLRGDTKYKVLNYARCFVYDPRDYLVPKHCRRLRARPKLVAQPWARSMATHFSSLKDLEITEKPNMLEHVGTTLASLPPSLNNLRSLRANTTVLTDDDLARLESMTGLEELELCPAHMERISASFYQLQDSLWGQSSLTSLSLGNLHVSDHGWQLLLEEACCWPALTTLELRFTKISDGGLEVLGEELLGLMSLNLTGSKLVTPKGLEGLVPLTALEELTMMMTENNRGEGGPLAAGLGHLTKIVSLTRLDLSWNESLTSLEGIQALTRLKVLDLAHCMGLDSGGLACVKGVSTLQRLNLASCFRITPGDVVHVAGPKLTTLLMEGVGTHGASPQVTSQFCKLLSRVSHFGLSYPSIMCGGGFQNVSMPHLVELNLGHEFDHGRQGVDDKSLLTVLAAHTQIRHLHLHSCDEVTQAGLQSAIQELPHLKELDVYGLDFDLKLLMDSHPNRPWVHRRGWFGDKHWMELVRSAGTYKG
eukprot:jgi/Tetstr1/444527/TSEL_032405.t2